MLVGFVSAAPQWALPLKASGQAELRRVLQNEFSFLFSFFLFICKILFLLKKREGERARRDLKQFFKVSFCSFGGMHRKDFLNRLLLYPRI